MIDISSFELTAKTAKTKGQKYFFDPSHLCHKNHFAVRYTASGGCTLCTSSRLKNKTYNPNELFVPSTQKKFRKHTKQPSSKKPIQIIKRRYIIWHNGYYCDCGTYNVPINSTALPFKAALLIRNTKRSITLLKNLTNQTTLT